MNITIQEGISLSDKIVWFEAKERPLADQEHRWTSALDFEKYPFTFAAIHGDAEIFGVLKLTIEAQTAHIDDLLVGHLSRGQWIGTALVTHAEAFAKEKWCSKIRLDTVEDRGAVTFYEKLGYEKTAVLKKHYFGKNAIVFTKYF